MHQWPWLYGNPELIASMNAVVVERALALLAAARLVHRVLSEDPLARVAHATSIRVLADTELAAMGCLKIERTFNHPLRGIEIVIGSWVELYAWCVDAADADPRGSFHARRYRFTGDVAAVQTRDAIPRLFKRGDHQDGYDANAEQITDSYGISLVLRPDGWEFPFPPNVRRDMGFALHQTVEEFRLDGRISRGESNPEAIDLVWLRLLPLKAKAYAERTHRIVERKPPEERRAAVANALAMLKAGKKTP